MTREDEIQAIHDVADEVGGTVRDDYSGRSMFGKVCYAIDCDDTSAALEAAGAAGLRGARTDSMGKGSIIYWPRIEGVDRFAKIVQEAKDEEESAA